MYVNKCTKCGAEFETKNPKRIICPNCLYPDRKPILESGSSDAQSNENEQKSEEKPQQRSSYSYEGEGEQRPYPTRNNYNSQQRPNYNRPQGGYQQRQGGYNNRPQGGYQQRQGGYDNNRPQGGYQQRQGGYNRPQGGGYNRPQGGYDNNRPQGGYQQRQGGYNRPQGGGYNNRPQGGFNNRPQGGFNRSPRPGMGAPRVQRELLVTREQLAQIEVLYKRLLPLPNPDVHEVIGAEIELEPRKVFFGINLVRQKMFLPKLPFPKRKLAVSADQLIAIRNLYEPLLPLPPIGCHKILASQLKMDEWRVHVGIGLVRKQLGMDRWNEGRPDAPEQIIRPRKGLSTETAPQKKAETTVIEEKTAEAAEVSETPAVEVAIEAVVEAKPKKTTRKKKDDTEEQA